MTIISDIEGLGRLSEKLSNTSRVGLDYECSSSHPHPEAPLHHDKLLLVGYGLGLPDGDKYYVPISHSDGENAPSQEAFSLLEKLLTDQTKEIWTHNSKYEYTVSRAVGIIPKTTFQCSMLAQWLLGKSLSGGRGLKLKPAVKEYLGVDMALLGDVLPAGMRAHEAPIEKMGSYCSDDALYTLRLGELWIPEMEDLDVYGVFQKLECPFAEVLGHMKESGFRLDIERIHSVREELLEAMKAPEEEFLDLTGVEITKNQQISKRLYDELGWWPIGKFERGKSGFISVDKVHRKALMKTLPKKSKGYRAAELKHQHSVFEKLVSTYTTSITSVAEVSLDGRLRADFIQPGTDTGRLSSSGPNLQNIPSSGRGVVIRETFIADPGWVICDADYSGADLVMMAHLSRDERMLAAFREFRDLHQQTADYCKCDRKTGKVLNLGLIYEMQVKTLANNLGISQESAKLIYWQWHHTYPKVQKYHERMHKYAKKHGFVRTITGRVRFIPDINSTKFFKRSLAEREASNTPDQGSVADVIKIAMRNLYQEWRSRGVLYDYWTREGKAKILSQVHDELIVELRNDFAVEGAMDVQRHMENAVELRAPMRASPGLGTNWFDAKGNADVMEKRRKKETDFDLGTALDERLRSIWDEPKADT